ncbi:MAG: 5'/3'-nucleotidase SurE [Bacteriovoracaceae bacterium]|jgi:5'-nucleotidase|nr:5'/3'-nucleotidase SurE [Bacteriovoracaceae bacterium]
MRILITNDDGINAPGIKALEDELSSVGDIITVAPRYEMSSTGHGISLLKELLLEECGENRYAVNGYPADCTLLALEAFYKDSFPDLVVSGINNGANLGQDRYYSGTVAAAREAALHGIPSVAVSLALNYSDEDQKHFLSAAKLIKAFIESGCSRKIAHHTLANINVPNLPIEKLSGAKLTEVGKRIYIPELKKRICDKGNIYYFIGGNYRGDEIIEGSDCEAVSENFVSLSCLDVMNREEGHRDIYDEMIELWSWD